MFLDQYKQSLLELDIYQGKEARLFLYIWCYGVITTNSVVCW